MFIKKLELFGFKTFAEKTEIDLNEGITAVVGPNGCGKSNVADAMLWVLGESNIRNLRGQRATDVIFNGTEKRRALGMAEVSLTLDNSCGTLPLNFNEVTVTRRAYRSGESEYFINKTRCRLKDIYELFLDTGMGREAYSFVTQGEIDAVLSAKAEDRRELLEEAAGIKKYRHRRQEALRKLERTEANLHRVRDIMAEIGGQVEPLAQQAEQAKRFSELQTRLRDIEIGLLIRDLRKFTEGLNEVRELKKNSSGRIEEYDKRLADLEWEKDKQTTKLTELEEEVENARRVQQTLSANVQRLESKAALIDEKLNSAQSVKTQAAGDISTFEKKIDEAENRISKLEVEEKECAEAESRIRLEVDSKARSLEELERRYEEASRSVNDQKANYLELAKELAAKRNALQNSKDRVGQLEAVLVKYAEEIENLNAQKMDAETRSKEAVNEIEIAKTRIQEFASEIARLNDERKKSEEEKTDFSRKSAEISREIASKSSRLSTLREMAESHEGFFEGVRSVMAAQKAGKLSGEFAVVADVLSIPKGYEVAIETALGANVQDIITDTVDDAKRAISFLKEKQVGRATFLPLDNMHRPEEVRGKMDRRSGAIGIAADLIKYDGKYNPAIQTLLGRTVIAEKIDDAVALSKQLSGWNKIVTLEGELIVPSGAITGGSKRNRGPELLQRKQEIESLTQDIKHLDKSYSELQNRMQSSELHLSELRSGIEANEKSIGEQRIAFAELQRRADFAGKDVERFTKQLETVSREKDEAESLESEETANVDRLQDELQAAGQENTDLDQRVAGAEQDINELQKLRTAGQEELMRLSVELASRTERTTALGTALKEACSAVDELTVMLTFRRSQVDGIAVDVTALHNERETVEREAVTQKELFAAADKRLNELVENRTHELEKAAGIDHRFREAGTARNQLAQDTHDADVKEARLEVQVNQAAERLLEEYEMTSEQALDWPDEIEVERGTATEVARIRSEIRAMGTVNIGAIQEYERIKERWDFLTEQRTDLESARDQINAAIREIDTNTRGLFMDTFNLVAANFDVVFKRLFGGGRTELSLTNPNDLLETGIDIVAQPPGKKMQDMALLSGGERALTATALIFALLMARPSPFVMMDEVDAPLDESNVERFADVLKEFAVNTQFIVVTHNRATMEAANSLYGVTMQEPGISKLVSVKITDEEHARKNILSDNELLTTV